MSTHYHLKNIRDLLTEGFTDEELRVFCYDTPEFRDVYDQVGSSSSKTSIIDRLIEHADRKLQFESLLAWTQEQNPAQYERHQPYYLSTSNEWPPVLSNDVQVLTSDDIVFDFSHNQGSWVPSPSLDAGYRLVKGRATGLGWKVVSLDKVGWLTSVPLRMGVLVLVCPYHRELEKEEINSIIKYVSNGGKLIVLGYFCIPHHCTNLNDLMESLGISFKYDLVLPLPPYQPEGTYWRPEVIDPEYIVRVSSKNTDMKSVSDTILKNVNTIGLHSSCSLEVTKPRGESVVLRTGQQQLVWKPQGIIYSSDSRRYWERIGRYTPSREKRSPLVAVTAFDKGKIAVIGSWTVFHDDTIAQTPDNSQLFENLLRWFKI